MLSPYVLPAKKKFVPPELDSFNVSFRYKDADYERDYAAVFSILGHENLVFSADSKEALVALLFKASLFIGMSAERLNSLPLGGRV